MHVFHVCSKICPGIKSWGFPSNGAIAGCDHSGGGTLDGILTRHSCGLLYNVTSQVGHIVGLTPGRLHLCHLSTGTDSAGLGVALTVHHDKILCQQYQQCCKSHEFFLPFGNIYCKYIKHIANFRESVDFSKLLTVKKAHLEHKKSALVTLGRSYY